MYSILHFADLHLDTCFAASNLPGSVGSRRRAALRTALEHIVELAHQHNVAAVTIGGDLYEQDRTTPETAEFLRQQFTALAPIQVFIAPGECDPYADDSLYAQTHWPENVGIFPPGTPTAVELASDIHLWGAGQATGRRQSTLSGFRADSRGVNLLLLHAAKAGDSGAAASGLFRLEGAALRASGVDLALLGHQHRGEAWRERDVQCIYPGTPEPLAAAEAEGDHQAILVTIQNGACTVRGIPVGHWRCLDVRIDVSGCNSLDEVIALIALTLRGTPAAADESATCNINLVGRRQFDFDIDALRGQVDAAAHLEYSSQWGPTYDLQLLAHEPTVRGLLVRRLQSRLTDEVSEAERARAARALELALRALDGRKVRLNEGG